MIKSLFCVGLAGLALNKLAYRYLLRSPQKTLFTVNGKGRIVTLAYNPIGRQWISPLMVESFEVQPYCEQLFKLELPIRNSESPVIFRPKAYHEFLACKLISFGLEVKFIKPLNYEQYFTMIKSVKTRSDKACVRTSLWNEAEKFSLTFAAEEVQIQELSELKISQAENSQCMNVNNELVTVDRERIIGGERFSIFFIEKTSEKILTPEIEFPVQKIFNTKPTIMRDSVIKLFNAVEAEIKISNLANFSEAFLVSDSFGLQPIPTISFPSSTFSFPTSKGKSLQNTLEKSIVTEIQCGIDSFTTLCTDNYTQERWSEPLI